MRQNMDCYEKFVTPANNYIKKDFPFTKMSSSVQLIHYLEQDYILHVTTFKYSLHEFGKSNTKNIRIHMHTEVTVFLEWSIFGLPCIFHGYILDNK